MPSVIVDLAVVILIAGITYALASEGLWGAALMYFNTLFAGIIAFNFYEPLASLLANNVPGMAGFADSLCLLLLFAVALLLLRLTTDSLGPSMVRFPTPLYHAGRWIFGLMAACVTMAILLLAFHTSPIHKKMFYGGYAYDHRPPFKLGLDWHWLGFFQYTTGQIFASYSNDPSAETGFDPRVYDVMEYTVSAPGGGRISARVFDPKGSWLIDHQNARPYGTDFLPEPSSAGAEGGTAGIPGQPVQDGLGIPGGTAGAAVGLAPQF